MIQNFINKIINIFTKEKEHTPVIPDLPKEEPEDTVFRKHAGAKILKNFFPVNQRDNLDSWGSEKGIAWNTCMVSSFYMFLVSIIRTYNIYSLNVHFPDDVNEEKYYKGLMAYIKETPEPDHRWQAGCHAKYINKLLASAGRSDLSVKIGVSSIEELKKTIDSGVPYPAGTWETKAGHIICFCGYSDEGAFAGNPFGQWGRKLGYYASPKADIYFYTWKEIEYLFGIKLNGFELPPGYGRTWSARLTGLS